MKQQETVAGQPKDIDLGYPASATPYFNGTSDQIDIPYAADINPTSFTVEMSVQFQGGRGYRAILTSVSGSASLGRRGYVFCVNAAQQWQFWLGSGQIGIPWVILTGSKAKEDIWTHLAGTYDSLSQTMAFYINGRAVGQYTGIQFKPNDRHPLHVGAGATEAGASSCFFHGSITKVRIWAKALSPVEIQTLAIERSPKTAEPTSPTSTPPLEVKQPEVPITSLTPTPLPQVKQPEVPITSLTPTPLSQVKQPEVPITLLTPTPPLEAKQPEVPTTPPTPTPPLEVKQPEVPVKPPVTTPPESFFEESPTKEPEKSLQPVLMFDGQDDYVEIPYSPTLDFAQAQDFAIEVWLKPDPMEESKSKTIFDINVLEKWVGTPFPYAIRYSSKNGRLYASRYDDEKKNPAVSCLEPINDQQFHHVAFVKQSSQLYLYVDGVEVASANDTTIGTTQNNSPLYLSRGAVGGGRHFFKGQMAEFRIWNSARSQVEIQADMSRRLVGNEPGLVGYWPLNEGNGDTVSDKTKNANHGQITGATWKQVEVPIDKKVLPLRLSVELSNFYTYAFLLTPATVLELPKGISDRVLFISHAGVSALVEPEVSLESLQNDDERLIQAVLSHDQVICELFRQTTILPLRFGTSFASKESLLTHLESHAEKYLEKLRQLNGKAEYILKFIPRIDEPVITPESGGRQYFLAKKQRYQTQQDFQIAQTAEWENAVHLITQIYKSAIVVQPQGEEARIYLLVSCQDEPLLAEQFLAWQKACSRWELQLGLALPPYHFI
ncbi:hypothetical protein PI95_017545 [Hassallia byssoidea VB512170]|uniref:LamG-like jellyroll fold domain-containing protein n=1 Tax=Hassallia byssoidea VB512170 TaxID=1304833 RepID=A0A846HCA4_9CYAN|nr:GvpL/GvpF family gas vesicle protein [Hassalia byssoidea]NEU74314.1 hypothetical protein [Hassalia byssoidea VB512170]